MTSGGLGWKSGSGHRKRSLPTTITLPSTPSRMQCAARTRDGPIIERNVGDKSRGHDEAVAARAEAWGAIMDSVCGPRGAKRGEKAR